MIELAGYENQRIEMDERTRRRYDRYYQANRVSGIASSTLLLSFFWMLGLSMGLDIHGDWLADFVWIYTGCLLVLAFVSGSLCIRYEMLGTELLRAHCTTITTRDEK
jgi:hypothetical protein